MADNLSFNFPRIQPTTTHERSLSARSPPLCEQDPISYAAPVGTWDGMWCAAGIRQPCDRRGGGAGDETNADDFPDGGVECRVP